MFSWVFGLAFAGQVHDLVSDLTRQDARSLLTFEGATTLGPCKLQVDDAWTDLERAQALLASCPVLADFTVEQADGYVHVYASDPSERVLDTAVTLAAGTRSLRSIREELARQLPAAVAIGGSIDSHHLDERLVEVPGGTMPARDLLRQLRPLPTRPWWEAAGVEVDYQARVTWTLRDAPTGAGLLLRVVDVTNYPAPEDEWVLPPGQGPTVLEMHRHMLETLEGEDWGDQDQGRLSQIEALKREIAALEAGAP